MPCVQEIIRFIKRGRGRWGEYNGSLLGPEYYGIQGMCEQIEDAVDQFGGNSWRSNEAKAVPEQRLSGHTVGVIPTRGRSGVVVDFTNTEQGPVIGYVEDIKQEGLVARTLQQLTGYEGWKKRG